MRIRSVFEGGFVAAEAIGETACDPADGGDAHPGQIVDSAIGKVLLQQLDDLPPVDECLQLRGRTQILEEISALVNVIQ